MFKPQDLLGSIRFSEFMRTFWTRQPIFIQRPTHYYRRLIGIADLQAIINSGALRLPSVQLVKHGRWVDPKNYTYDLPWGNQDFRQLIDVERVLQLFNQGSTVVFQALHLHCARIDDFCEAVQRKIGFPTTANAYLTPPNATGFAWHADLHQVFILQIEGSKTWSIQGRGKAIRTIKLTAGDLLYLPKGTRHQASTDDSLSAHVTVAVNAASWFDLFRAELERYKVRAPYKAVVPSRNRVLRDDEGRARALLGEVADGFRPTERLIQFRNGLKDRDNSFQFQILPEPIKLLQHTKIRLRRNLSYTSGPKGNIIIESKWRIVELPRQYSEAINKLRSQSTLEVRKLRSLSLGERRSLVTLLAKESLIQLLAPSKRSRK